MAEDIHDIRRARARVNNMVTHAMAKAVGIDRRDPRLLGKLPQYLGGGLRCQSLPRVMTCDANEKRYGIKHQSYASSRVQPLPHVLVCLSAPEDLPEGALTSGLFRGDHRPHALQIRFGNI